jgi:hypothetical protein
MQKPDEIKNVEYVYNISITITSEAIVTFFVLANIIGLSYLMSK